jgi:hypothetical protein
MTVCALGETAIWVGTWVTGLVLHVFWVDKPVPLWSVTVTVPEYDPFTVKFKVVVLVAFGPLMVVVPEVEDNVALPPA